VRACNVYDEAAIPPSTLSSAPINTNKYVFAGGFGLRGKKFSTDLGYELAIYRKGSEYRTVVTSGQYGRLNCMYENTAHVISLSLGCKF
jgi:long-subunit fatty acid transport protein